MRGSVAKRLRKSAALALPTAGTTYHRVEMPRGAANLRRRLLRKEQHISPFGVTIVTRGVRPLYQALKGFHQRRRRG